MYCCLALQHAVTLMSRAAACVHASAQHGKPRNCTGCTFAATLAVALMADPRAFCSSGLCVKFCQVKLGLLQLCDAACGNGKSEQATACLAGRGAGRPVAWGRVASVSQALRVVWCSLMPACDRFSLCSIIVALCRSEHAGAWTAYLTCLHAGLQPHAGVPG